MEDDKLKHLFYLIEVSSCKVCNRKNQNYLYAIYITDEDMPADEIKTLAERRTIALMRAYELLHEKCRITEKRIVQLTPEKTFALCQIIVVFNTRHCNIRVTM